MAIPSTHDGMIAEINAGRLCSSYKRVPCHVDRCLAFDGGQAGLHRRLTGGAVLWPVVQKECRRISQANNDAVSVNPAKLDYDGLLEGGGTLHDAWS
jgi:hypothetical protein